MTLTTSAWDRPIQGVSQQPPKVRLGGQCTTQENAVSSVVNGLVKRPGTKRIATILNDFADPNVKWHYYNRGTNEQYIIAIAPNQSTPLVWDINGNQLTVENELAATSYTTHPTPNEVFSITTISDFTFIANNTVAPVPASTATGTLTNIAIVNVQFCDYGRTYSTFINGVETTLQTPQGDDSSDVYSVDTAEVARMMLTGDLSGKNADTHFFGTPLNALSGFSVSRVGNTLIVQKTDGTDFTITTQDGADGRDLFVVKNSVKSVSDLPLYAPNGYKVKVVGEGNTDDDDYWLEAESSSGDTVTWRESTGPAQSTGLDKNWMPVTLIRDRFVNGLAVFKLKRGAWVDRKVGDSTSNPFPSFVQDGVPIQSVGTLQNRLYVTAGESVVYTQSNDFFNFFRTTVRTKLDDDPIDVYADTNQINVLQSSVTLDGDAVFFSQNGQFVQRGDQPITKENATLMYASTFESLPNVKPVAGGDVIFFAFGYGRFTGIREFYTDSFTDTKRARPITDHVDQYIEGDARLLATSTNRNQLLVLSDPDDTVYVYNFLWQGQERVQSSWSKWVFDGKVAHIAYDNETIYLVIERDGKIELEYIETGDPNYKGTGFPIRLDRQFVATATRLNGHWEISIPYAFAPNELVIVRGNGCFDPGVTVTYTDQGGGVVYTDEDIGPDGATEVEVVCGVPYTMIYEPTMPFIRDRNGSVIDTDRLTINDVYLNYDQTGLTTIEVENDWGAFREYTFNGRVIGAANNLVGFAPLEPGRFKFPVRQQSDRVVFRIVNRSHLPFQLRDMEWRGRFHQRGRRV